MKFLSSPVNIQVNTGENVKVPKNLKREFFVTIKKEVFTDYKKEYEVSGAYYRG